ncbi:hypothetical protein [Cytobacillus sp. FSL K6-0265]|uniref:hypothetical protein n=1 Tax=Cytobacillus sp. FSL K6-0265 TaxID=2921448 RepID=UPI0030F6EE65
MKKMSRVVGFTAGLMNMLIWAMFTFFNPYSSAFVGIDTALLTFFLLALPALFIMILLGSRIISSCSLQLFGHCRAHFILP